jgi:hypothetical protein
MAFLDCHDGFDHGGVFRSLEDTTDSNMELPIGRLGRISHRRGSPDGKNCRGALGPVRDDQFLLLESRAKARK